MAGSNGSIDVLVTAGEEEERIETVRLRDDRLTVSVAFQIGNATLSLTFDPDQFVAFAYRIGRFARDLPGKPS